MRPLIGLYPPVTIEIKVTSKLHWDFVFLIRPLIGLYPPVTIETKATSKPHCNFFLNETFD